MAKNKYIESPEQFLELFYKFREEKLSQKISVPVVTKTGTGTLEHVPPLTWNGFDAWLFEKEIINDTAHYRANLNNQYADYLGVIRAITNIMYAQKFEGAAVGAFNANIIARDLGLKDAQQIEADVNVRDISQTKYSLKVQG